MNQLTETRRVNHLAANGPAASRAAASRTAANPAAGYSTAAPRLEWSDEALLAESHQRGDARAFAELVHRYERELYSYLRRYLGDAAMAEDVFQATFLQIHLKSGQFEEGRKFRPWLYTIATHQAIDAQRRNKRHRMVSLDRRNQNDKEEDAGTLSELLVSKDAGPAAHLAADERRRWIRHAVKSLPDSLRSAVTLVYYQGLKYREAAEALSVPVGTVKSRLHTAITRLNEAWNVREPSGDR